MESIKLVKGLIQEGDWLTKLDLKDAYLILPVHQAHQKSEVPMARPTVAIQSPSLWFEQRPIRLHQAYEASGSIVEEVRNTNYPIFGRHALDGRNRKRGKGGLQHSSILTNITGLHCEHGKEHRVPITTNRVPGFQSGFTQDDYCSPNT